MEWCVQLFLASTVAIFLLYHRSQMVRFYLKFFIYFGLLQLVSFLCIPFFVFQPKNASNSLISSFFIRPISRILGIKWTLRGREHLTRHQACIVVINHQSSLDVLGFYDTIDALHKITFVSKEKLFYAGFLGTFWWLCDAIFVPRNDTERAKRIINQAGKKAKEEQMKLYISPEGTRSSTGQIQPFRKGAFHVAIAEKLPVVPVVNSRYYFLDHKMKKFDGGQVYVTALPPISTENLTAKDVDGLMEQTRNAMVKTFDEVNEEIAAKFNC